MNGKISRYVICLVLALGMLLSFAAPALASDSTQPQGEATTILHTQTTGDSNYFTFSETGWSQMGSSSEHVWSDDPGSEPGAVWYTVHFVGNAIDIYAGKNWPMGYVEYFIDDVSMGSYSLYHTSNINSTFIAQFAGLTEGEHIFKAVATGRNGLDSGKTNDLIDCAQVVVYHQPYVPEDITLAQTEMSLVQGSTRQITFVASPSYAQPAQVTYTSDKETVATVSDSGLITAVTPGTAEITLTCGSICRSLTVTVTEAMPDLTGSIVDIDTQWTQDRYEEAKGKNVRSGQMTAWKNDVATSQLALVSVDSALKQVSITASDFVSGGNTIPASCVRATFLRSTQAYNGTYLGYGDPTRELPAATEENRSESVDILWTTEPVDVGFNELQPVWVEITVPKTAAAGTYQGSLTVTAEGLEEGLTFSYTLTVQDVTLPDATEFAEGFDIELWQYPYSSAEYYGVEPFSEEHFAILRSIMEIYKSVGGHAITASIQEEAWNGQTYSADEIHYPSMIRWEKVNGVMTYDYTDFDAWVTFCREEIGIGDKIVLYSIAPWHNSIRYWEDGVLKSEPNTFGGITSDAMWEHFLKDLIAHLEEKGWFDDAYIGIDERGFSAAAFDLIESVTNDQGKCLKTAGAMDKFVDKWDLAMRVTDLNVGDSAAAANPEKFAQLLQEREAKGYRTTLYSCTEHQPGQFSLSAPVESYWAMANAGKMGGAGFLRWAYDAWVADPLNDTTHNAFEPGDCFLIFPDGKDASHPTAHRSVRLARMAQGIRDVNKLLYIEKNAPVLAEEVADVFGTITTKVVTSRSYLSDSGVSTLCEQTEAFQNGIRELTEIYIQRAGSATDQVASVTISQGDAIFVPLGGTEQLTAKVLPDTLLNTNVLWSSSDETIVSVKDGLLTGHKQGVAVVTATSVLDAGKSDTIRVTVDVADVAEDKLESYYSFDRVENDVVSDEWGSYPATLLTGASVAEGISGNALSVTTAGVGALVKNNRELDTDWTVAYWVKTTADFSSEISVTEDEDQKYSTSLKMAANRDAGFRVGDEAGQVLTFQYAFQSNTWYHLTWVQDKDVGLTLYVNGTVVKSNNWTKNNTVKAPIDVIGGNGFTGLIDEVKIYNAPLTAQEIQRILLINGVNLLQSEAEIQVGGTYQIEATVISDQADKSLTYESADTGIARVNSDGLVTGVARGTTTVTVTNPATGFQAKLKVKVTKSVNIHNTLQRYVMPETYLSTIERSPGTQRQYLGQPDMIRTATGRLIVSYPVGHGKGPLVMQISDDGGLTWTEKTDLPTSWAGSQETPTMYVLNVGGSEKLMLITACPGWGTDSDGNQYGWNVSCSDDNGETWSEYTHFYSTFSDGTANKSIVAMASLVQLKNEQGEYIEKWMGVYHNYDFVNYKTYLTFNADGSMNWTEPVPYLTEYRSTEQSHQICEVGMFRSPDGNRIVALARSQSHQHLSTMFYSDDEGETWSEPVELPGSLAGERHKAMYDSVSGKLLITFREIQYDRNNNGLIESGDWYCGDWGLWVGTYDQLMNLEDGEYCVTIDEDFTKNTYSGDTGYAGFVQLSDGTFVMCSYGHWEDDFSSSWTGGVTTDLCYIRQARFRLEDLEHSLMGRGDHVDELPKDHECDICGEKLSECADSDKNHECDVCGATMGEHKAAVGSHICDYCGKVASDCVDTAPVDHKCDICGATMGEHKAAEGSHICDYCGKVASDCVDTNPVDHKCDICGATMGEHKAAEGSHNCAYCGKAASDCVDTNPVDHKCDICGEKVSDCTDTDPADHNCDICGTKLSDCIDANGDGKCDICGAELSKPETSDVTRVAGAGRWGTAIKVADELKEVLGVEKFSSIIVASGNEFADALAGSYLATVKNAPILLSYGGTDKYAYLDTDNIDYIKANLTENGTVYILGGTAAVPASYEEMLEEIGVKYERLSGSNRYGTNLAILKAAGVADGSEILVCTGESYADSLSASATGKPILLVQEYNGKVYGIDANFLDGHNYNFTIIGGTKAVSKELEDELGNYTSHEVTRLSGGNRFETSVMVAERYFTNPDSAVLAYAWNYPDGLCGGALAYAMKAPLVLTMENWETAAVTYARENNITTGCVLGGEKLVSNSIVRDIFTMAEDATITQK